MRVRELFIRGQPQVPNRSGPVTHTSVDTEMRSQLKGCMTARASRMPLSRSGSLGHEVLLEDVEMVRAGEGVGVRENTVNAAKVYAQC
jgi:hypothetical protein